MKICDTHVVIKKIFQPQQNLWTPQGIGILKISDINQGGWYRFFFPIYLSYGEVITVFFLCFTFPTGFSIFNFSIEFFVIDRSFVYLVIKLMII